jgi:hypothetical protein
MPKIAPFHTHRHPDHHDNSQCGPGSEVPKEHRISGTGGKPLCKDCAKLDTEGK